MRKPPFAFEEHQMLDGRKQALPVPLDREGKKAPEADTVIMALGIIDASVREGDFTLPDLLDQIGSILKTDDTKGCVIEDPEGYGSVIVRRDNAVVVRPRSQRQIVPTGMLFDTVYKWNETLEPKSSS